MRIRYVDDYYDKLHEKFPKVSKKDIKTIADYGLRSFYMRVGMGADVLLKSPYFTLYCGKIFTDWLFMYHYRLIKLKIKTRFLNLIKKLPYNGRYYFGMTEREYEEYKSNYKNIGRKRSNVTLKNLYAYRILEELIYNRTKIYIFEIDIPMKMGYTFYKKTMTMRNNKFRLIGKRIDRDEIDFFNK